MRGHALMYPDTKDFARVNEQCNAFPYKSDPELFGRADDWTPGDERGSDCESYAMAKFGMLFRLGWPPKNLRLACCYVELTAAKEKAKHYHGVLVVTLPDGSERGLDNRFPGVLTLEEWQRIGYEPDIIQMAIWPRAVNDWEPWRWAPLA